jgi:hypothetical protein
VTQIGGALPVSLSERQSSGVTCPVQDAVCAPAVRHKVLEFLEATGIGTGRYISDLLLNIDTTAFDVSFAYSSVRTTRKHYDLPRMIQDKEQVYRELFYRMDETRGDQRTASIAALETNRLRESRSRITACRACLPWARPYRACSSWRQILMLRSLHDCETASSLCHFA